MLQYEKRLLNKLGIKDKVLTSRERERKREKEREKERKREKKRERER